MRTCKNCIFFQPTTDERPKTGVGIGRCEKEPFSIDEMKSNEMAVICGHDGGIFVGEDFGCINFSLSPKEYVNWVGSSMWTSANRNHATHIAEKGSGIPLCGRYYKGGTLRTEPFNTDNVTCKKCFSEFKKLFSSTVASVLLRSSFTAKDEAKVDKP